MARGQAGERAGARVRAGAVGTGTDLDTRPAGACGGRHSAHVPELVVHLHVLCLVALGVARLLGSARYVAMQGRTLLSAYPFIGTPPSVLPYASRGQRRTITTKWDVATEGQREEKGEGEGEGERGTDHLYEYMPAKLNPAATARHRATPAPRHPGTAPTRHGQAVARAAAQPFLRRTPRPCMRQAGKGIYP